MPWHGDERNRVIHHRRNASDGRRRQYRRNVCRCAVTQHDSKYRFLHRPRSGVVDGNYCGRHAVPVFGGAEYDYGAEEEKGIRKKWMTIPRSGCSDRGIGVWRGYENQINYGKIKQHGGVNKKGRGFYGNINDCRR